jgi:hypothetical protein
MQLSGYEQQALEDTEAYFRQPEDSLLGSLLGRASRSLFKPVEIVSERLIPDKILEMAGSGVEAIMGGISNLSDKTVSVEQVLREARKHAEVATLGELRALDLRTLDAIAAEVASQHQIGAMLEGAGCGLGGAALLAADIPLLFGVSMRVVRQISACYGIDPEAGGEAVIALKVFELACGGTRNRYAELLELDALCDELDQLEPQRRAEKAAVLASLLMSREATKRIVSLLLSRKLLQALPLVGAAVGAGFNYLFVADVSETATQIYRRRFLQDKRRRLEQPA